MPNKCTYGGVYASLMFCKGKTVLPGVRNRLYFIPKAWIVKWPKLRAIGGDMVSTFSILDGSFFARPCKFCPKRRERCPRFA
ncbi:MAG: hypothetical protein J6M53_05325 [Bacteroidaceae bacterium]|nr:hypothetical protein [Bacteroidaceae bacterium]